MSSYESEEKREEENADEIEEKEREERERKEEEEKQKKREEEEKKEKERKRREEKERKRREKEEKERKRKEKEEKERKEKEEKERKRKEKEEKERKEKEEKERKEKEEKERKRKEKEEKERKEKEEKEEQKEKEEQNKQKEKEEEKKEEEDKTTETDSDKKEEQNHEESTLFYDYINRKPFTPTHTTNLRDPDAYPAPPPAKDDLCSLTPPAPIPPPQGRLQQFIDFLLSIDSQELSTGDFSFSVPPELYNDYHYLSEYRAKFVRDSACFAWAGYARICGLIHSYRRFAWGADEVRPMSGKSSNNWSGIGMTLLDGFDTLELLGLHKEFENAAEWVKTKSNFDIDRSFSVFETTIRVVGSLLSAYEMTKNKVFLDKAVEMGNRLLPAFDTPSGYPRVGMVLGRDA